MEIMYIISLTVFCCLVATINSVPASTAKPVTQKPTKPPSVSEICARLVANKTDKCDACVSNSKCFYCLSDKKCKPYPSSHVFPTGSDCPPDMGSARWGTCLVNFKILLIVMGVLAGIILIVVPCCIYCCCCRSNRMSDRNRRRLAKEEEKWQREIDTRRARREEEREERQKRYDEIRQKYGLVKPGSGGGNNYSRFENEA